MIKEFTMNKEKDIAIFKLGGSGFHEDLHRMCSVVKKANRHFDGERWHVKYASQYAQEMHAWWPEFTAWVNDFENQMELPLLDRNTQAYDKDPDDYGTQEA